MSEYETDGWAHGRLWVQHADIHNYFQLICVCKHGRFNNTFTEYCIELRAPVPNRTATSGTQQPTSRLTSHSHLHNSHPSHPHLSHLSHHLPHPPPTSQLPREVGGGRVKYRMLHIPGIADFTYHLHVSMSVLQVLAASIAENPDYSRLHVEKGTLACLCTCTPCEGIHA